MDCRSQAGLLRNDKVEVFIANPRKPGLVQLSE